MKFMKSKMSVFVLLLFSSPALCNTFKNDLISFDAPQGVKVEEYDIFLPQPFYEPRRPRADVKWYVFPREKSSSENSTLLGRAEYYAMSKFYVADGADGGAHGKAVLIESLKSADGNEVLLLKVHVVGFGDSKHDTGLLLGYLLAIDTKKVTKKSFYTAFFYSEDVGTLRFIAKSVKVTVVPKEVDAEPSPDSSPPLSKTSTKVQVDPEISDNGVRVPVKTQLRRIKEAELASAVELQWKIFKSNRGYTVNLPESWKFVVGPDDDPGKPEEAEQVEWTDLSKHNSKTEMSVVAITHDRLKDEKALKEAKGIAAAFASGQEFYFSTKKIDKGEEFLRVEQFSGKLRFIKIWFCGLNQIEIGAVTKGPAPKPLYDSVKSGKFALPAPFDKIFNSLKCS
jgi:hypothetical protein